MQNIIGTENTGKNNKIEVEKWSGSTHLFANSQISI